MGTTVVRSATAGALACGSVSGAAFTAPAGFASCSAFGAGTGFDFACAFFGGTGGGGGGGVGGFSAGAEIAGASGEDWGGLLVSVAFEHAANSNVAAIRTAKRRLELFMAYLPQLRFSL
jgi:hypothetical protein